MPPGECNFGAGNSYRRQPAHQQLRTRRLLRAPRPLAYCVQGRPSYTAGSVDITRGGSDRFLPSPRRSMPMSCSPAAARSAPCSPRPSPRSCPPQHRHPLRRGRSTMSATAKGRLNLEMGNAPDCGGSGSGMIGGLDVAGCMPGPGPDAENSTARDGVVASIAPGAGDGDCSGHRPGNHDRSARFPMPGFTCSCCASPETVTCGWQMLS